MKHSKAAAHIVVFVAGAAASAVAQDLQVVRVTADNTEITQSCRLEIAPDAVIADADNNGVIHIAADDITIDFGESSLRGAKQGSRWDQLTGFGLRLDGHQNVTLKNAKVHGYKVGIYANNANGLVVEDADLSDNYRAHLGSTPEREDSSDWLSAHHNDRNQWITNYGGALYVEDSSNVTIRRVKVRRGQNGILLDNVNNSKIYDNDASFLSGWGLGMWRSSRNTITRNAFDFCVRGHVEGVYNRGQDSAGILMFEQCNDNVIAENSVTHGGDCIFGFGGLHALGQFTRDRLREQLKKQTGQQNVDDQISYDQSVIEEHTRKGCNGNIFADNDLSYAPAHGLEMTFSFDNVIYRNRFVENAICGIWGGFSQDTLIYENLFDGNGGMAYGLERGGVNIEHSAGNLIIDNKFIDNRAGVHLWWDPVGDFESLPWAKANYRGVTGNFIADNTFVIDDQPRPFYHVGDHEKRLALHFRNDGGKFDPVVVVNNKFEIDESVGKQLETSGDTPIANTGAVPAVSPPTYQVIGETRPVKIESGVPYSVRNLKGRDQIIMDEWGPWDHQSPLIRRITQGGGEVVYELLGVQGDVNADTEGDGYTVDIEDGPIENSHRVTIKAGEGVVPYAVHLTAGDFDQTIDGTLINARWLGRAFSWEGKVDPREDFDAWWKLARGGDSRPFGTKSLNLKFGWGGPKDLAKQGMIEDTSGKLADSNIGSDHFGIEAIGRLRMTKGKWRIRTVSDDGVRVYVISSSNDNTPVIDNWTYHGPTPNQGEFSVDNDGEIVVLRVLHFEIDGFSTLSLELEPVK